MLKVLLPNHNNQSEDHIPKRVWSFSFTDFASVIYNEKDMIYLKNTTDLQMLYVPKLGRRASGNVELYAVSTINNSVLSVNAIDEDNSLLYHKMLVELDPGVQLGEYEYLLTDEIGELSSGILVIGELDSPVEYVNETEYEQYEN